MLSSQYFFFKYFNFILLLFYYTINILFIFKLIGLPLLLLHFKKLILTNLGLERLLNLFYIY